MTMLRIIALSAALLAGVSSTYASETMDVDSLGAIQSAWGATVLTVNANEARFLAIDNDVTSVRARIMNNPHLLASIERQGFMLDQIVGVSGDETSLTLYAR
jgi:hypothetical protein